MALVGSGNPLNWVTTQVTNALGTGSAKDQIVANTLLGGLIIVSSSVSLGATLVLLPVVVLWFVLGILRLNSTFDSYWPL